MNETFNLPVQFKGQDLNFPSKLLMFGYSYKIAVDINGTEVLFERDEERNYRAIVDLEKLKSDKINIELLKAIAEAIEALIK